MKRHFLIVFFLLSSCKQAVTYTVDVSQARTIHSPQNVKELEINKYSEVFDSIRIVQLETSDSALIGRVDKILLYDNKIFILDQTQRKAVLEFDLNGRFIRRYGHIGRGPGEYVEPNDISLHGKELSIWVNDQRKFVIYDLNGNFLREVRTATLAKSGVRICENKFALYLDIGADVASGEKFDLQVQDDKTKKTYVAFEKIDKNFSKGSDFFSQNENRFLVSPGYSNDIYEIDTNTNIIRKKYSIDMGKYIFPADFPMKYVTTIKFQQALTQSAYAYLSNYWETDDYLIYAFVYKGMVYDTYYSKGTGKIKCGNAWFNNVYGIFAGANKGVYGDQVIALYDPAGVETYKKNFTFPPTAEQTDTMAAGANKFYGITTEEKKFVPGDFDYSQEEINRLQSIKTSDNPIVLIEKLKHF